MGKTITEKIISAHSGKEVSAGEIALAKIDFAFSQDGTSNLVIDTFNKIGAARVFNPKKCALVIDHSAPSPVKEISNIQERMRQFARKEKILLYDLGCGVSHQVIPERGHLLPGNLVIGADSHTCTYGALNLCACGMGSSDVACAFISGETWFKVPKTIKIVLKGKLPKGVYAKDLILHLIGDFSAEGANYLAIEFSGETIPQLSMDGRFTICNMVVEMGAKFGIMPFDNKTGTWLEGRVKKKLKPVQADKDANYVDIREYKVPKLEPQIAKPHTVDNVSSITEVEGTPIQEAFLGTCTNGRLEDLIIAAKIIQGKKIHPQVKFILAPASREILLLAMKKSIIATFLESGAVLVSPGCGPCVGTNAGIPADGENVISTANRNFKGRMGNPKANIYLASPATVAASAITGKITDPRRYLKNV